MNEWSDHTPISFSLSCNNVLVSDDDVYLSKYKWSQVPDSFKANLIDQLPLLNKLTSIIERSQACINNVYRKALWFKLFKSCIQGKALKIIRDVYQSVKSCV